MEITINLKTVSTIVAIVALMIGIIEEITLTKKLSNIYLQNIIGDFFAY